MKRELYLFIHFRTEFHRIVEESATIIAQDARKPSDLFLGGSAGSFLSSRTRLQWTLTVEHAKWLGVKAFYFPSPENSD